MRVKIIIGIIFLLLTNLSVEAEAKPAFSEVNIKLFQTMEPADSTNKQELLKKVRKKGLVDVWVHYKMENYTQESKLNAFKKTQQRKSIAKMHENLLSSMRSSKLQFEVTNKMKSIPRIAMFADEETLRYLYKSSLVQKISEVEWGKAYLSQSTSIVNADDSWDLGFTGDGEVIVIVDSGVDYTHPMLQGKIIDEVCFSTNNDTLNVESACPGGSEFEFGTGSGMSCQEASGCDHGTHVAGIAAGNAQNLSGVAKKAGIISVQVFSKVSEEEVCENDPMPCTRYRTSDLVEALEYIYDEFYHNKGYNMSAVNLSLGSGNYSSSCDGHVTASAINNLTSAYISVVAASGNDGNYSGIGAPACVSNVISVGATDGQDQHAAFSNGAPILDLVAPGVNITSAVPGGSTFSTGGTSQAAPHVAGTIALMREASGGNMHISTVRDNLRNSAYWNDSPGSPWGAAIPPTDKYGHGRLDTYQAIATELEQSPLAYVTYDNQVIDQTFEGKNIYVLKGNTAQVSNELILEENSFGPSTLYIHGTLTGPPSAEIKLYGDSEIVVLPGGSNNFSGTIEVINILDSPSFSSNTTITQSTQIQGVTTISSGVNVTVSSTTGVSINGIVQGDTNSKITSNGNLIIESGTTLNDVEVIIENGGELIANGLTLDGKGLVFNSGSDGQITGSTIKNANRGIELNGSTTPLIEGNTIEDNSTGIWVNSGVGSGAEIIDNYIATNSANGIASYYSYPTIEHNYIYDNSSGFFGIGTSASFYYNQFESNTNTFFTLNGSSISSATFNYTIGSQLHINAEGASSVVQFSQNDFIPTGSGTDYIARAKHGAMILAHNNYFQQNVDPGLFYATDGASISYSSASQPFRPTLHSKVVQRQAQIQIMGDTSSVRHQRDEQRCTEVGELLQAWTRSAQPIDKIRELSKAAGCWRSQGKEGFGTFLEEEIRPGLSNQSRLYALTLELENLFLMDQGKYEEAIPNYETLRKNFADDPSFHQSALFGLGYIYSLLKKDARTGGHYLAELQQRYPESSLARQAGSLAEAYSFKIARLADYEDVEEAGESPEQLSLSNYPNPFNPVTEISYSLPKRSQVSLIVYDMLGRQVAELINQQQSAGFHNISFDASKLSSGIYLYRLQAGNEVVTGRMTLVK